MAVVGEIIEAGPSPGSEGQMDIMKFTVEI